MATIVSFDQASAARRRVDTAPSEHAPARLPLSWGILYPQNALVAVIDDYGEAARAAGIAGEAIEVLEGRCFLALHRAVRRRRGLPGRLAASLSRLFSDDASAQQALIDLEKPLERVH